MKKKKFDRFIDCIQAEGLPPQMILYPMIESVAINNVGFISEAILSYCKPTMNHNDLMLTCPTQIISKNEKFGENLDFIIIQTIHAQTIRYVLVVEEKRDALEKGLTQLLLALKSIWDVNNDKKLVYGFVILQESIGN
ncbi:unnamed protein product [Rotaria socialis]|uniref:Uncharacterized protein n=1 Tax=Rotaria socialis TaxID=392032 RepID=A0A821LEQ6_9BILA|nr:unnamed protein product [Rotaria socialis]CAF3497301.1 unnamed protein product [Rotaria socialis]CAF3799301.1 unnamed protein product [Rotaria socialis]CAF4534425.1 unnamed protein product [Rotaria socialis]CAF4749835.1 unnamed protein product [Rotaria socialis]